MFKRRIKLPAATVARNFFWPRIGWSRSSAYLMHRLGRLGGSPHAVAAGLASGIALSFTPFVGFHFLFAASLAWIIRGNVIASAIGTAVGNPWTFPFIWVWTFEVGLLFGAGSHGTAAEKLDFVALFGNVMKSLLSFDFNYLAEIALPIYGPMLAGSVPTSIAAWVIAYFTFKPIITSYQNARRARRNKKGRAAGARKESEA